MPKKKIIPIGTKFDKLTVIGEEFRENNETMIRVICTCGKEYTLRKQYLVKKQSTRCYECYVAEGKPYRRKGIGELSGHYFGILRKNAEVRNIPFEITIEELYTQYQKQNGICALSGIPIKLDNYVRNSGTASVDRIDSSKSYNKDNIQWVHKHLNIMKQSMTMKEFLKWCTLISEYYKEK